MENDQNSNLKAPKRLAILRESRTALDVLRMAGELIKPASPEHKAKAQELIIVAPGFGSDDRYTLPLRYHLNRLGFRSEGWGLGMNLAGLDLPHGLDDLSARWTFERKAPYRGEAGVPFLADKFYERVLERHTATGASIILIGWSLGGYLAREVARDLPKVVSRVITMGSPTVGGPKYTAAAAVFRKRGMDLDWIEREIQRREQSPIKQPITAIYSETDAIVDVSAAIDRFSPDVNHIHVDAAHLGMGFNPTIWRHIVNVLDAARPVTQTHPTLVPA